MKTFEQWFYENEKSNSPLNETGRKNRQQEAWNACDSEWKKFLEQEHGISYQEWVDSISFEELRDASLEDAFNGADKSWRHLLANKRMAIDLNKSVIASLEQRLADADKSIAEIGIHNGDTAKIESVIRAYQKKYPEMK